MRRTHIPLSHAPQGQASDRTPHPYPSFIFINLHLQGLDMDVEPEMASAMSSLVGLTIQQILDLDVENLAVKIDKHHCQTKKAVLVGRGLSRWDIGSLISTDPASLP